MDDDPARAGVRDTYDRIADHFSATREYAWPEVESFLDDREGTVGLDLGCGNGRHAELLADVTDRVLAVDVSRGLLGQARERVAGTDARTTVRLVQGDAASLPIRVGAVDLGVFVATLHHLPSRELRVASLDGLARGLASEGRALVSAWSTAHDRFDADDGFDTTVDWTLPGGERVPRFYHIYSPGEFRDDLDESGLEPVEVFVSSGNCYAVVADGEGKAT
jgi:tRNA (uracil-5-)-methyltransferase TRM9